VIEARPTMTNSIVSMLGENSTVTSSSAREHEEVELHAQAMDESAASAIDKQTRLRKLPCIRA